MSGFSFLIFIVATTLLTATVAKMRGRSFFYAVALASIFNAAGGWAILALGLQMNPATGFVAWVAGLVLVLVILRNRSKIPKRQKPAEPGEPQKIRMKISHPK